MELDPSHIESILLEEKQDRTLPQSFLTRLSEQKDQDYCKLVGDKLHILDEYSQLEKELQAKRQQLELDLNSSILRSKVLNAPENTESPEIRKIMKQSINFDDHLDKRNKTEMKNSFIGLYKKINSESRLLNDSTDDQECTFQPKINKFKHENEELNHSKNRLLWLYEESKDRQSKKNEELRKAQENIKATTNFKKVSLNSKKIAIKNLEKNLFNTFANYLDQNNKELISFEKLGEALLKLLQTHEKTDKLPLEKMERKNMFDQLIWKALSVPQMILQKEQDPEKVKFVPIALVIDIFIIILESELDKHKKIELIHERIRSSIKKTMNGESQILNDLHYPMQDADVDLILKKFSALYPSKVLLNIYEPERPKTLQKRTHSQAILKFQPVINPQSKIIASSSQETYSSKIMQSTDLNLKDSSRFEILYEHSKYALNRLSKEKEQHENEEYKECTFKPQINEKKEINDENMSNMSNNEPVYDRLHRLHIKKIEDIEASYRTAIDEKEESELEECTFFPKTNDNKNLEKSLYSVNASVVKGADKIIERISKARDEKKEREEFFDSLGRPKSDSLSPTVFKPFSFEKRVLNGNKEEPLLYLDINYGPGRIARIPVRRSDDPHQLSRNFARIYSLNEKMRTTLLETIQNIFKTQLEEEKIEST